MGTLQVNGNISNKGTINIQHNSSRYDYIYFKNNAGNTVGFIRSDCGNATNVTQHQWLFASYSANSTNDTATTGYYEYYYLPASTDGLTATKGYEIFTSKSYSTLDGRYVNVSGDTMTGSLTVQGNITMGVAGSTDYRQFTIWRGTNNGTMWMAGDAGGNGGDIGVSTDDGTQNMISIQHTTTIFNKYIQTPGITSTGSITITQPHNLYMQYSSTSYAIIQNHSNGNVSIGAASGSLHIGWANTTTLYFGTSNALGSWNSSGLKASTNIFSSKSLCVSQTSGAGYGLSLYGESDYTTTYGIMFGTTEAWGTCYAVVGTWATYFTMGGATNRGWIFKDAANSINVASLTSSGVFMSKALGAATNYYAFVGGGKYITNTASITGYLKITLPVSWNNCMLRFDINIFNYAAQNAVTYTVGGYNYAPSPGWYQTSASSTGFGNLSNLPVTFGHDGSKCCVYIGTSGTGWSYPQVTITNVTLGYSNYSCSAWATGWSIEFTTTAPSYATTIYNPNLTARAVNYGSTLPSSGYHAGALFYKT